MKPIIAVRVAAIALALSSIGCPSDELINAATVRWRLLAAVTDGATTRLALYDMPAGTLVSDDVYASANGDMLDGSVARIEQFRSMLFLLQPDRQRIEVLDATTFRRLARIATAPHGALGICFANGTTAYIANGDSTVGVVDLTTFQTVRTITVGAAAVSIAALGNRVAVCNRDGGTVSIIDTRSNTLAATVSVPPYPAFVVGGSDPVKSFCIVSLGSGKLASNEDRSAAVATFYDPFADAVGAQIELTQYSSDALSTLPRALVAGGTAGTVFVVLDQEVQMFDHVGQRLLGTVLVGEYRNAAYDFARDLVLVWMPTESGTTVVAIDPRSGATIGRAQLPIAFSVAAGL
jgi:YVTN family beta-propeller protein